MEYIVGIPKIEHVEQLIELNTKFLITNIDEQQREKGFIRIKYSREDFEKMIRAKEIVVGYNYDTVVAYYLIGRLSPSQALDYQRNKTKELVESKNYIHEKIGYGCQVCISKDFRHIGLFRNMLKVLSNSVKNKYDYLLCSISDKNRASLKAHTKNDWQFIDKNEITNFYIFDVLHNSL